MWQWTYGDSSVGSVRSVQPTADGGYILPGGSALLSVDSKDVGVLKLDANGDIIGCINMSTSNVTSANSSATTGNSVAIVAASSATAVNGTTTAFSSSAVPQTQCYYAAPVATDVPTLSEWMRIGLGVILAFGAAMALRSALAS